MEPTHTPLLDISKLPPDQAVARVISYALTLPASDLFITSNEQSIVVAARHLGVVRPISVVHLEQGRRILQHMKALAGMDVAEKRRPQDGRWLHKNDDSSTVDLRMNMIPTLYGEDLALRVLSRDRNLYTIDKLGLTPPQASQINAMLDSPSGLILITGPTGSGKTASLYACLMRLNDGRRKINTIEDPIEYAIDGLRQSQVNPQIDLGFAILLRSVLRQSPDVIMVGEVRDPETAETAVRAANSGQLVFATIHAAVAAGAIQSMRGLGVQPHFLATSLRGVVSQRLVRTLCPSCKVSFDLDESLHTFDEVKPWLGPGEGRKLYAHTGCAQCNMLGYTSRTGVFEVMPVTRTIRDLIADGGTTKDIRNASKNEGMLEFRQSALLKVAQGVTSTEEVFRVIPSEHLLDEYESEAAAPAVEA